MIGSDDVPRSANSVHIRATFLKTLLKEERLVALLLEVIDPEWLAAHSQRWDVGRWLPPDKLPTLFISHSVR